MKKILQIESPTDELHTKIGGGIPLNSLFLIEASPGVGKSILAQRLAYGALINESTVTYISSELTVRGFLSQMESLNYDIKEDFIQGKLKFVTLFPSKGTISYEGMIDRVLSSDKLMGSDLIIFDTLSEITLKNKVDEKDHIELLGKLKKVIGMGDGRSIVLCVDPSTMDEKLMGMLRRLSEVYLVLEEREIYGSKLYYMVIKRYLGARNSVEKEIPYKVRAGIGIVIELAS